MGSWVGVGRGREVGIVGVGRVGSKYGWRQERE